LPHLTQAEMGAWMTEESQRNEEQVMLAETSDKLIKELQDSDILVLSMPMYNFGVPSTFKAWVDRVARAGMTFRYTENGPVGLLENKKVFIVVTSGGTEIGADNDFLTPWLTHCLNFIGVTDVDFIKADKYTPDKDTEISQRIDTLTSSLAN